eukprot:89801_1
MSAFVLIQILIPAVFCQYYMAQSPLLNWLDHECLCLWQYDTHLASIHNTTENNIAHSLDNGHDCWIGLEYIGGSTINDFEWADQTPFDYGYNITVNGKEPWKISEPDFAGKECIEFAHSDGKWNDRTCAELNTAICNKPSPVYIFKDNNNYVRIPEKNKQIASNIAILDEIHITFRCILNEWHSSEQWTSIFALQGTDIEIRINNNNHELFLAFDTRVNAQRQYAFPFLILTEYFIEIFWTQNKFIFISDNNVLINETIESHTIKMSHDVYLGFSNIEPANATITSFTLSTSNSHYPFPYNYLCDYYNRFTEIVGNFSYNYDYNNNNCELTIINTGEANIVWMGD